MQIDHCDYDDGRSVAELAQAVIANPRHGEIVLLVSKSFYELDDQARYETIYDDYYREFGRLVAAFSTCWGSPRYQGRWDDTDYPDWAVGEEIASWEIAGVRWHLRIDHEDRELPIIISLAQCDE